MLLVASQLASASDVLVDASLESGGNNFITILPGESFTANIVLIGTENMTSGQTIISGEGAYFYAADRVINSDAGWDTGSGALPFTPGPLPSCDIGAMALNVYVGATSGVLASVTIEVDPLTPCGTYNIELVDIVVGDLSFENAIIASNTGLTVNVCYAPPDFDKDGYVDQEDLIHFEACATGPGIPQGNPNCADAKLDGDLDVDQDDFAIFQRCYSGADEPADPSCAE